MRAILFSTYYALDNGITYAVPIDLFENGVMQRNMSAENYTHELQAALHEGDLEITSPGMIGLTESGTQRYARSLQLV